LQCVAVLFPEFQSVETGTEFHHALYMLEFIGEFDGDCSGNGLVESISRVRDMSPAGCFFAVMPATFGVNLHEAESTGGFGNQSENLSARPLALV
jgi:hypothetical protein